jgi:DNA helicase-2/ATP-dependent DNA helicase PcrA
MMELNPQQTEAVQTVTGPLLVLAGAGSGKTRVITHRIVHLIERAGVAPWQILAVTFTNKAAGEMKSRVDFMLGSAPRESSPLICTFHSFCVRILRRHIEELGAGYTRNFTIYDEDDQARLVRAIRKEINLEEREFPDRSVLSAISRAKSRSISPAAYAQGDWERDRRQKIARVYALYEERLTQSNALDFDDLLIKAVSLLRRNGQIRDLYHQRYRHVMIDEFQDTNMIQYELARLIVTNSIHMKHEGGDELWDRRSLCVVGDVDQSIYSWRGSDFNIILGFQHDFEGTKIIKLEDNYRSTQTILNAANGVIQNNSARFPKTLYACEELGQGEKIRYCQSYDGEGESSFVAERVQRHLRQDPATRCAVLYRTNAQSRLFEESLRRRGIPYNIVGGFSFYERAEVKDIIAYLKLALNPHDDMALGRAINSPPRGIGKVTLEALTARQRDLGVSLWETMPIVVEQQLISPRAGRAIESFRQLIVSLGERAGEPLAELVKAATIESGYIRMLEEEKTTEAEGRLLNIEELVNAAAEAQPHGESLLDFIDHAALVSDTDQYKADAKVTLLTMHSAKGLEFPVVFIVGMEEGLFPLSRASETPEDMEEERRLCYVAITRAQRYLYITHVMKRSTFGQEMAAEPSRFLNELPLELIQDLSPRSSWLGHAELPGFESNRAASTARETAGSGDYNPRKGTTNYKGKTYNSAESVAEFFGRPGSRSTRALTRDVLKTTEARPREARHAEARGGGDKDGGRLSIGSRVRHPKYGKGVVLHSEGIGEEAKLTVSFPGYGQKKFIAKFAALEKV